MFFGCWYYKNVAPPGLMLTYTLSKYSISIFYLFPLDRFLPVYILIHFVYE
jgi:hypothetical protein